jgi:hypothetical protein
MPGFIMLIGDIRGNQFFEKFGQVGQKPRFVFDGSQGAGGTGDKGGDYSGVYFSFPDFSGYGFGYINDITVTACLKADLIRFYHFRYR